MDKVHILYIEDNFGNRMLVRRVLEAEGYSITEAIDGPAGLEMAAQDTPDLILLDINLPEIDGYDLAKRLRGMSSLDGVPILAVTANVMKGDRERTLAAGCDGYIQKPIDVDRLPEQIKEALQKTRQSAPAGAGGGRVDTGVSRPAGTGVSRPAGTGVSRPAGTDESRSAGTGVSRPAGAGVSRPAGTGVSRPVGTDESRPAGTGVSRPAGTDESGPAGTGVSGPAGTDVGRPAGTDESRPAGAGWDAPVGASWRAGTGLDHTNRLPGEDERSPGEAESDAQDPDEGAANSSDPDVVTWK